ncbi:hypothetical protein DQ04_22551000, partial [Trypanosoma grayi]|uniref:hypothetical protein n=1 Tax=Trypanosoma grayi TaxID=71804 RepID=UPI0004F46E5D
PPKTTLHAQSTVFKKTVVIAYKYDVHCSPSCVEGPLPLSHAALLQCRAAQFVSRCRCRYCETSLGHSNCGNNHPRPQQQRKKKTPVQFRVWCFVIIRPH